MWNFRIPFAVTMILVTGTLAGVGRAGEMPVFVESARRNGTCLLTGLTDNYLRVDLGAGETDEPLVTARLTGITDDGLAGERVATA